MKKRLFGMGDEVLITFDPTRERIEQITINSHVREVNGKIATINDYTDSRGEWYYKVKGVDYHNYLHESMFQPVNLSPDELSTRLIRGQITFDAFERFTRTTGQEV